MKASELNGAELDYWVARAEGWTPLDIEAMGWGDGPLVWSTGEDPDNENSSPTYQGFSPSTKWKECGRLIEKYQVDVYPMDGWSAAIKHRKKKMLANGFEVETDAFVRHTGPTPQIAICRCVVASVFGEMIEASND